MYPDINNDLSLLQRINNCQHFGCLEKSLILTCYAVLQSLLD